MRLLKSEWLSRPLLVAGTLVSIVPALPAVPLDVDADGAIDAIVDGELVLRYLFGFGVDAASDDLLTADSERTPQEVRAHLDGLAPRLDVDGDGKVDALSDGILIRRYLSGYTGTMLIEGALSPGATRTSADDIGGFIDALLTSPSLLAASIYAAPLRGAAPLEVALEAIVTGGAPSYSYAWDLDGDGVGDATGALSSFVYTGLGPVQASLTVTDAAGTEVTAIREITLLAAPTLEAMAAPVAGAAPLEVTFTSVAADADGELVLFEWDFDGDGSFDWSGAEGAAATHTYSALGSYVARLRVTDNDGLASVDAVEVSVGAAPIAEATINPADGTAPLDVTLTAAGADTDGAITSYEWDLDGDGAFDVTLPDPGPYSHRYEDSGVYVVTLRVTDDDGLRGTDSRVLSIAGPPEALPGAYPTSGPAPLSVNFFASGRDLDGSPKFYDWDYDGDGDIDDHLLASSNSTHSYAVPGTYDATLTVTDDDGLTGSASIRIEVREPGLPSGAPTALAAASPTNGGVPLTVVLTGLGSDPDGSIALYEWDLDGNGSYDWQEMPTVPAMLGLRVDVGSDAKPAFHDLDADGDLDLLVGDSGGRIDHYENIGNAVNARWRYVGELAMSDGSSMDVGSSAAPVLGDLDDDGDPDLLVGNNYGRFDLYLNDGTLGAPAFVYLGALLNTAGATIDLGSYATPTLLDTDADGDLDLIAGASDGRLFWLENIGTAQAAAFAAAVALTDGAGSEIDVGSYSAPTVADLDGDGQAEILVGEDGDGVYLFSIDRVGVMPALSPPGLMADLVGEALSAASNDDAPATADIDGDGDLDLFIGDSYGNVSFYRNQGDAAVPSWWRVTGYYDYPNLESRTAPSLFDFDDDGDLDPLFGSSAGYLHLFENIGDATTARWQYLGALRQVDGNRIDVGSYSSPAPFDLDGDGVLDLLVGENYGRLVPCSGDGEDAATAWTCSGYLLDAPDGSAIDVGYSSAPFPADIDLDGDPDLFVGESNGNVNLFRTDRSADGTAFVSLGSLTTTDGAEINVGSNSVPALADLDGDGDLDLLVGTYDGTFSLFLNDAGPGGMAWRAAGRWANLDVGSYAAPALGDLDGDGDPDLLYGNGAGDRLLLETTGALRHTYALPGSYTPRLRVTDDAGNTAAASVEVRVATVPAPMVYPAAHPQRGDAPLTVSFGGAATSAGSDTALYEWDFDGDGTYDHAATTPTVEHVYSTPGAFDATLRATDALGRTGTESVRIDVEIVLGSSRTSRFFPATGGTATITTTLNGRTRLRLRIVDAAGTLVRTLLNDEARAAGEHADSWDGRNDAGALVPDGVYYYVVEYLEQGVWQAIDLRDGADYAQEDPPRSWTSTFDPYAGQPLEVSYDLDRPAEVSLYFWTRRGGSSGIGTIDTDRTLILREPRDAGSHTELWDGVDDKGVLVEPGLQYPLTLWAYSLPDNAIIVAGNRPEISEVSAAPVYFNPAYNPYAATVSSGTAVTYRASEAGTARVRVLNGEGQVVARRSGIAVQTGLNRYVWDGKALGGQPVPPGAYSIELIVTDALGNRSLPRHAAVVARY